MNENTIDRVLSHFVAKKDSYEKLNIISYTPLLLEKEIRDEGKKRYKSVLEERIANKKPLFLYVSESGLVEGHLMLNSEERSKQLKLWEKLANQIQDNYFEIQVVEDEYLPCISGVFGSINSQSGVETWDAAIELRFGIMRDQLFKNQCKTLWIGPEISNSAIVISDILDSVKKNSIRFSEFLTNFESILDEYDTDDEYFKNFGEGKIYDFVFLQMDLAHHSAWFENSNKPEATEAKRKFVIDLSRDLLAHDFHKLYWRGDGGIFIKNGAGVKNYDFVVDAADQVINSFNTWKEKNKHLNTNKLGLRLSAHAGEVFAYHDRSLWTSTDLNWFAKYEREIAENEKLAVTKSVFEKLYKNKSQFNSKKPVQVPDIGQIDVFIQD
ncbi:MAG: hypothetical protein KGH85_05275 [Thaumarchaeota archaeon]|nr:hypothetical protein [Nitrososphaerota archaeon]